MPPIPEYSVVFLGDQQPPTQLVLLKRSPAKKFAPNMYTGIGGHREESDATIMETMRRELKEETGIEGIELTEFAKLIISKNDPRVLYYAFGLYDSKQVLPDCNEGTIEWVDVDKLDEKDIIPTTAMILDKWQARDFAIEPYFSLHVRQTSRPGEPIVLI